MAVPAVMSKVHGRDAFAPLQTADARNLFDVPPQGVMVKVGVNALRFIFEAKPAGLGWGGSHGALQVHQAATGGRPVSPTTEWRRPARER